MFRIMDPTLFSLILTHVVKIMATNKVLIIACYSLKNINKRVNNINITLV